ncbi:20379_t:CDS:10 [Funneliformis geosporum]|uniref:Protein arginine N-methyltransferase n=1 Tax=Funneliformis geosporum TaxID=1117311 RepID=A0A9W4SIU2_9GLOM|nr:12396_t:CDS:10 [Funneliformis geosporum]CAI2170993.1 20379_t:CDS:10 [Funneliformis geosporum]
MSNNFNKNVPRVAVGVFYSHEDRDTALSVTSAKETGHDFIILPITHSDYKRFLFEKVEDNKQYMEEWRNGSPFLKDDLIIQNNEHVDYLVGKISDWIDLDTSNHQIRTNSEIALNQQFSWAAHLGLNAILVPTPTNSFLNYARSLNRIWMRIPIINEDTPCSNGMEMWEKWNKFRTFCENHYKLSIALELSVNLPDEVYLERWFAEPIKAVLLPTKIFLTNVKGYPVLSKKHQGFVKKLMKYKPSFVVFDDMTSKHQNVGFAAYQEYIRYINRSMPEPNQIEQFGNGYQDFLQSPLQPLMDNLESSTYEIFEKDPVKYALYEKAVYYALLDRVSLESNETTVIMVVGAGRGPLVTRSINAAEKAKRKVRIYAVEKNPNAFVILQNMKSEVWGDKVTILFGDMRKLKAPEKADILVSELLGSFGDNELSPECLDGAQKFLKPDGISIPSSYRTFISPISSSKLYNEVSAYKDLVHFETPYVVMFQSVAELAKPQEIWQFEHPNGSIVIDEGGNPLNNYHNTRYSKVTFNITNSGILHGMAGYFESVLYKDVTMSILPATHSEGMFSWFPIFFPLKVPIYITSNSTLDIYFWRLTSSKKVWYEWCVDASFKVGTETKSYGSSNIQNVGGRSSWIGL